MATAKKPTTQKAAPKLKQWRVDVTTEDDKDPTYVVNAVSANQAVLKAVDRFVTDHPKEAIAQVEVTDNSDDEAFVYIP